MPEPPVLPPLFKRYPGIEKEVGWINLGIYPTPVQQLKGLGFDNLWIKRDDMTATEYGGNKVRKLEFVLAEVKKQKKKRVVTFGAVGTNHGLATAIYCQKLNLDCTLLVFKQPITPNVKQNVRLFFHYGADVKYKKSLIKTVLTYFVTQRLLTPSSYFLFAGGSNILGVLGFVNAAFELKNQIDAGDLPEPQYIIAPIGTGGTVGGLALGTILAGIKTKVIGVRVSTSHLGPLKTCTPETVQKLMQKTYGSLKNKCDLVPEINIPTPVINDNYYGQGYGYPTEKGQIASRMLKEKENITLDPCYTAKAFAAVLDQCGQDKTEPILFWHTYNGVNLEKEAQQVDTKILPEAFQKILSEETIL